MLVNKVAAFSGRVQTSLTRNLTRRVTFAHQKPTWRELLKDEGPLLLPAAHDALTAKILEEVGFKAYQVGGFASVGARHAHPDIDLSHYGENSAAVRDITSECSLPVMVDADDGYGDVKNVHCTIRGYEMLGASAIFIEDQVAPKRCGHMTGKMVVPTHMMVGKVEVATQTRLNPETFIIARTDARAPFGLSSAMRRAERYLLAGADGIFIEGPESVEELEEIGIAFRGTPMIANMLEGGGKTPILPPSELYRMGFQMITYPTSILFRATKAVKEGALDILHGKPLNKHKAVDFVEFERIVDKPHWEELDAKYNHVQYDVEEEKLIMVGKKEGAKEEEHRRHKKSDLKSE